MADHLQQQKVLRPPDDVAQQQAPPPAAHNDPLGEWRWLRAWYRDLPPPPPWDRILWQAALGLLVLYLVPIVLTRLLEWVAGGIRGYRRRVGGLRASGRQVRYGWTLRCANLHDGTSRVRLRQEKKPRSWNEDALDSPQIERTSPSFSMDPLSVTASIIAVLQLSKEIVNYINSATGSSKERRRLRDEVRACEYILQQIKDGADDSEEGKAWSGTIAALEAPGAPLGRLWIVLSLVSTKIQPSAKGAKRVYEALRWPFAEKEVAKIVQSIEREKSLLQLALINESRKLVQDIQRGAAETAKSLVELFDMIQGTSKVNLDHIMGIEHALQRLHTSQTQLHDRVVGLHELQTAQDDIEERRSVLEWLTTADYAAQQNDFINRREPGTGEWLTASPEYEAWVKTPGQNLFCPGIPGAGKTILASAVVDDLVSKVRTQDSDTIAVAFIYCSYQRQDQKLHDLLRSIAKQLAEGLSILPAQLLEIYHRHNLKSRSNLASKAQPKQPSIEDILHILKSVVEAYTNIYVVIDALDECSATDQHQTRAKLLTHILNLQSDHAVSLFATSRYVPDVLEIFRRANSVTLEIRASRQDMETYLRGNMVKLRPFVQRDAELQNEITSSIAGVVDGMFLLGQLYLVALEGKPTKKALRNALVDYKAQSQGATDDKKAQILSQAYDQAWDRINGQQIDLRDLAHNVLAWITYAQRPLTTTELIHALAVEPGSDELDEANMAQIEDMVSVCAGLVIVDEESNIIRLVHYTTQEYLQQHAQSFFPGAEGKMADICVTYQSFSAFSGGFANSDQAYADRLKANPFYSYSQNWGAHARSCAPTSALINFLQLPGNVEASSQLLLISHFETKITQGFPRRMTGLHLLAFHGLCAAAEELLKISPEIDPQDTSSRTPLWYAIMNGNLEMIALLIKMGADYERLDSGGTVWSALRWAARFGQTQVVEVLLQEEFRLDIDVKSRDGITPLAAAVINNRQKVVEILLERGAQISHRDNYSWTPFLWAASFGYIGIVRLLVEKGVNIEEGGGAHNETALSVAAQGGHSETVKYLLEQGASATVSSPKGRSPWSHAAQVSGSEVLELFFESGRINAKTTDILGRTCLWWACNFDLQKTKLFRDGKSLGIPEGFDVHEQALKFLLARGSNPVAADKSGQTPLMMAMELSDMIGVRTLVLHMVKQWRVARPGRI